MLRQLTDGGELKKFKKRVADRHSTGSQKSESADTLVDEEIDPAEFFDPEEFGIKGRQSEFHP